MERFINILIVEQNELQVDALKIILTGSGNNLIFVNNKLEAFQELNKRSIGIVLVDINNDEKEGFELLDLLTSHPKGKSAYKIVICKDSFSGAHLVRGIKKGAVDFISIPLNPNLVKAKIEVFKALYFKDLRINQLLENIFPQNVLLDLNNIGKFSPKRIEEATVIFTDFVAFSKIAKREKPLLLLKKLEDYFNKFDAIIDRYNLEKIKTIGDAYMATAGVTEKFPMPEVRTCLAAIEMRDFMINQANIAKATNEDYWEIRIGLHSGPLVAGIIGNKKMSFDVWGDTVNTAARAEQNALPNSITVTERVASAVNTYCSLTHRGNIEIKHGGKVDMYFVENIKSNFSLFSEGRLPNHSLRKRCGLIPMDFEQARKAILTKLKSALPEELTYHDLKHTIDVEKAADRLAILEGIEGEELILLKTAVLFHDAGFLMQSSDNEVIAIRLMEQELPKYGYTKPQIQQIGEIIGATIKGSTPKTLLEQIMCDADHDYLGRVDYMHIAQKLRKELALQGREMTEKEWILFQIDYLKNQHKYFTETAKNLRQKGKEKRISELYNQLNSLQ